MADCEIVPSSASRAWRRCRSFRSPAPTGARSTCRDWSADRRFRTGKIELKDYDYQKPSAKLLSDANGTASTRTPTWNSTTIPATIRSRTTATSSPRSSSRPNRRRTTGARPTAMRRACSPGGLTDARGAAQAVGEHAVPGSRRLAPARHRTIPHRRSRRVPDQIYQGRL